MPANDNAWDQQAGLISAAHAAASWARARRAQWAPAATASAAPAVPEPSLAFDPAPSVRPAAVETQPPPTISVPPPVLHAPEFPSAARRTLALGAPFLPWLARGAVAAALVAGALAGGRYLWEMMPALPSVSSTKSAPSEPKPVAAPEGKAVAAGKAAAVGKKGAGSLRVTSTPPGASVLVDGKSRGVTPLTLADLSVGRHEVALQSDAGTVKRTVTVAANETATVDEAIFSGFVTVYSPFDVTITEGGRVLRADDRHQVMLAAGTHDLRFSNRALAYDVVRQVDIKPGEATNLQLSPEPSPLTVTANDAAEVWLDGARLGDTPLNAAPVPLGTHEIVVKRASGGERRYSVTIGAKPFTLNVEF